MDRRSFLRSGMFAGGGYSADQLARVSFAKKITPASGEGALQGSASLYDVVPEALQADFRTGLFSGDATPYFQAICDRINPGGAGRPGLGGIYIPGGRYPVVGSIPMQDGIEWRGDTKEGTRIQVTGSEPAFSGKGDEKNLVGRAAVRDLTIIGAGKNQFYSYGIELVWMHNPVIENVQFQNLRWCITQEYTVNALITKCTSVGKPRSIRGYFWMKAISAATHHGCDNTAMMSDCYFMAGDIGFLLHGANGLQTGGNVNMLQCTNRIGAFAETRPDGSEFMPGENEDPVHFLHLDGFHTDSTPDGLPALYIRRGDMPAIEDVRVTSMWGGNIAGGDGVNGTLIAADGVTDLIINACQADSLGRSFASLTNCERVSITGCVAKKYGGGGAAAAIHLRRSKLVSMSGNSFSKHALNASPECIRAEDSERISVANNVFETGGGTGVVLSSTTKSVVSSNIFDDGAVPVLETGTANFNRIMNNVCTVAPEIVGLDTLHAFNDSATT
ncbi:right-handed parallel beta-helix repeat-containing protein [Pararhizobium sp. LjRoot238]|uniref:right-handed parallel beta-helix repeat-containing protein n=1 Tax=Pararhizobium sp. LjRoot238 TaxID=3342293 RepID=UPI003ECFCDEC